MALNVDLTNHLNWNRLGLWQLESERRESGNFTPLVPFSVVSPSPLILAAGFNPDVPAHWFAAAWVTPSVSVDPGSLAQGVGLAIVSSHPVPLNRYALIEFPRFVGVTNYVVTFQPVRYISKFTLEAWWYDGEVIDTTGAGINRLMQELL